MPDRPHILIFNPDQWRGDVLGHVGNPAAVTPNLDRAVATDFVSFRNAFCQNPVCTPSRCSFMTGWYPHTAGHRTMHHLLHPHEPNLLRTLKRNGYFVWWGGKNDLMAGQLGWRDHCDVYYRPRRALAPSTHQQQDWRGTPGSDTYYSFHAGRLEPTSGDDVHYDGDWAAVHGAIDLLRSPPEDRPLCIFLALGYPHPPYGVEEPWFSMIDRGKLPPRTPAPEAGAAEPSIRRGIRESQKLAGWSEERWTELRATYYGMCARVDHQFGLVMEALQQAGLYDDTAVFFFADHGDFTGDFGLVEKTQNTFEDCLTRVPLLVKPPAGTAVRPRVSDALVELIDVPATIEALTGLQPPHTHFGRPLLNVLAGRTDAHRDAVFCEGGRLHGEMQCMERESTRDTEPDGLYWPRLRWQIAEGPEHTKAAMCRTDRYKYVRRFYESDELYDVAADPRELTNRIDDPALAGPLAELKERMLTWYMATCDAVPKDTDRRRFE